MTGSKDINERRLGKDLYRERGEEYSFPTIELILIPPTPYLRRERVSLEILCLDFIGKPICTDEEFKRGILRDLGLYYNKEKYRK